MYRVYVTVDNIVKVFKTNFSRGYKSKSLQSHADIAIENTWFLIFERCVYGLKKFYNQNKALVYRYLNSDVLQIEISP